MRNVNHEQYNPRRRRVNYSGTSGDVLKPGYAVCYDSDHTTAGKRKFEVEKPKWANLSRFAGVVAPGKNYTADANGDAQIDIVDIGEASQYPGMSVWTDGNIAAGDLLEIVPDSFFFKKFVGFSDFPQFRSNEAQDRSSTDGLVQGDLGRALAGPYEIAAKATILDFPFHRNISFSETANLAEWLATIIDGAPDSGEITTIADAVAGGALAVTTNDADNDANQYQLNGEVVSGTDSMLVLVKGLNIDDADTTDWFVGLAATDTTVLAGVTDRIGFGIDDGTAGQDINLILEKDSTQTTTDTTVNLADATDVVDLAVYYDVDQDAISFWQAGTKGTSPVVTNVPDDVAMTPTIAVRNADAAITLMKIKHLRIGSYYG